MHFTEQLIESLNNGKIVVSDVGATIPGIITTHDKLQFLYEACSASVKENLSTAKVPVAVKAAGVDADGHWTRQNLAQVIWLLAQEVTGQEMLFTKLKDLVQDLQKAALVGKAELLEVAPMQFLSELGVVPPALHKNKEGQVKGNVFYKLNKFNALREENEGFSKMLVCLQSFGAAASASPANIPQIMMEIRSLIGYFDLDPNRVAALTLDIFQDQWDNAAYLQLLPLFSVKAVSASLAFIYAHYKTEGEVAPDNLYKMTVQLIKVKAVTLDGLWIHLSPDDADLKGLQEAAQASALEAFKSRNNLNKDVSQIEVNTSEFGISAEKFNLDPHELLTTALQPLWADNQKLEILRIAFEMEELDLAWRVYSGLKSTGMEPADYPPISAWMARRVLAGISPSSGSNWQQEVQETPLPSMSMEAEVLLNRMGLSFSYSNELWIRLTRYWKQFLLYHQRQAEADGADTSSLEAATSQVCHELVHRLIPGMSLMTPNPFFTAELWSLLDLLPYTKRFELYEDVSRLLNAGVADSMDTICLKAAADSVYRLAKRIASRMGFDKDPDKVETAASKKEKDQQVKGLSRNFAKVSHANPIIVAEYLVSYAQNNGTHIDSLTDAMTDLSDVVLDVITFRVIRTFTVSKIRYKPDNVLLADPLASASRFAAMAARKLTRDGKHGSGSGIELHALLQMILNAGLKSHSEVFVILGDLMDVCAAVHVLEDVGDTELPALAGGDILKTVKIINKEVRLASKVARAGMDRLGQALTSKEHGRPLAVRLFVLLAQNRALHVIGEDRGVGNVDPRKKPEDRIRVVSDRFDQANRLLVQYAEFLRLAIDKSAYRELMPPLSDLLDPEKYGLEPEVAFLLYRPILSRVPFPPPPAAKDEEDGEIPEGEEAPMEVEHETSFGDVRWSHLLEAAEATLPPDAKKGLTKPFYLLFWKFTFSDICNATSEYDKQIRLLQREQAELQEELQSCGSASTLDDRGYTCTNAKYISNPDDRKLAQKHYTKKQEPIRDHIKLLERERSKMEERWKDGVKLFRQWKGHLLAETEHSKTIPAFLDQCVLPRCTMTPEDAMYCAAFVRRMALEDTPFFSFMRFSQMLVSTGLTLLHTMTDREADNFGIFFREILRSIQGWWVNQDELTDLLPRQGFRLDAIHYARETAKHASKTAYNSFVRSLHLAIVARLVEVFKANGQTNVNLRAAVNGMLVLNKIKTVFPMITQHARNLMAVLKPIFIRLEPAKDPQGNFTEQPVPLYNLAIKCHNDLNTMVQSNAKFDAGATSIVPTIRLYDKLVWDPQYTNRPAPAPPAPRPPSAAAKAVAQPAAAAPASGTEPAAAPKISTEASAATRAARDGTAKATTTGRGTKDAAARDGPSHKGTKEAAARDGSAKAAADGRNVAGGRGRETGTRNGKEPGDKGTGRERTRAAADDNQLAEVREAALKKQSTVNGTAADGTKKGSPLTRGEKAVAANGSTAAAGTKRRAADAGVAETRLAKAAKTDSTAAPQAEAAKATAPLAARPSTRSSKAIPGDKQDLRADAPVFKPLAKHASDSTAKRTPAGEERPSSAARASVDSTGSRSKAAQDKPLEAGPSKLSGTASDRLSGASSSRPSGAVADKPSGAGPGRPLAAASDKPSGASAKPPVHPEQPHRATIKRGRDAEASADVGKVKAQADTSKAIEDEQEPKRRKHKPIAWQAPDAAPAGSKEPMQRSTTAERQEEKPHDDPRRTASDPVMATRAKVADTKHEQREGRRVEEDKRRTQADEEAKRAQRNGHHDESDQKHAQRDGHRAEPEGKRAQRDSEAKHAQRDSHHEHDLERAKRAGVRDRNVLLPHDSRRPRGTDGSTVSRTADRTRINSSSRSDERRAATKPAVPDEHEDGEVQMTEPDVQPALGIALSAASFEKAVEQNGVEAMPSPSRAAQDGKDDSDGKDSKRSHRKDRKEHKDRHKSKHKSKDHKKDRKEPKDPEREKAKAQKKAARAAEKAAAASAFSDAAAQPASSPASAQTAPRPVDVTAAPAKAAPNVPRLVSSIAKPGNRASPTAPSGLAAGGSPEPSSRQHALVSAPRQGAGRQSERGRGDTPPRSSRGDNTDGSGDRIAEPGAHAAAESLPATDLRHLISRGKSNPDQSLQPEKPPAEPVRRPGSQLQHKVSVQAPKHYPDDAKPRQSRVHKGR